MLPTAGLIDHTTDVSVAPVNVAVHCCVCEVKIAACPGLTDSVTVGRSRIATLPDWVASDVLVAVTTTVCGEVIETGAVYLPPVETAPTCGFNDQVTAVLPGTVSVEVSSSCADARSTGVTDTGAEPADKLFRVTVVCAASKMAAEIKKRFNFIGLVL